MLESSLRRKSFGDVSFQNGSFRESCQRSRRRAFQAKTLKSIHTIDVFDVAELKPFFFDLDSFANMKHLRPHLIISPPVDYFAD